MNKFAIGNLHTEPPLEIMPRDIFEAMHPFGILSPKENELRIEKIGLAIMKYERAFKPIPQEWWDELEES